jgi:hypothetical protein
MCRDGQPGPLGVVLACVADLDKWFLRRYARAFDDLRPQFPHPLLSTVNNLAHPIRSAITVAGIVGHSARDARICNSAASTSTPRRPLIPRRPFDHQRPPDRVPTIPSRRTIALIGTPSAR